MSWVHARRTTGFWIYGRKLIVAVVGTTIILLGLGMLALPGPAILVIPFGIAILGIEFAWARRLQRRVKEQTAQMASQSRARSMRKRWAHRP